MDNLPAQLDPAKLFQALHDLWESCHYSEVWPNGPRACKRCGQRHEDISQIQHEDWCEVGKALKTLRGEE